MSDLFDDATESVLAGLAAEQAVDPMRAIACFREAIDALGEDRMVEGARVPYAIVEAQASGHLLRVLRLYGDDDDEVRAVAVDTLDRWDVAMRVDREATSSTTFVKAMVDIGRVGLRTGDLDLARRLHDRGADVAADRADEWLAPDTGDPLAHRGPSAMISLAMFEAAVLDAEGRAPEAAVVLRDAIRLIDSLGGYPVANGDVAEQLAGESLLVGRFVGQALEVGWDPSELAELYDRHAALLLSSFEASVEDGKEQRAALAFRLLVGSLGRAPACGRADAMPALARRIEAAADAWAQTDSVIASVLAGDLPAVFAELGVEPDEGHT